MGTAFTVAALAVLLALASAELGEFDRFCYKSTGSSNEDCAPASFPNCMPLVPGCHELDTSGYILSTKMLLHVTGVPGNMTIRLLSGGKCQSSIEGQFIPLNSTCSIFNVGITNVRTGIFKTGIGIGTSDSSTDTIEFFTPGTVLLGSNDLRVTLRALKTKNDLLRDQIANLQKNINRVKSAQNTAMAKIQDLLPRARAARDRLHRLLNKGFDECLCSPAKMTMIYAPNSVSFDRFSHRFDMTDTRLLVSSRGSLDDDSAHTGRAYVFRRVGSSWELDGQLRPPNTTEPGGFSAINSNFGFGTAIHGDLAAVAALKGGEDGRGEVMLFKRTDGIWSFNQTLVAPPSLIKGLLQSNFGVDAHFAENGQRLVVLGLFALAVFDLQPSGVWRLIDAFQRSPFGPAFDLSSSGRKVGLLSHDGRIATLDLVQGGALGLFDIMDWGNPVLHDFELIMEDTILYASKFNRSLEATSNGTVMAFGAENILPLAEPIWNPEPSFGCSLAVAPGRLWVGAFLDNSFGERAGAVYDFVDPFLPTMRSFSSSPSDLKNAYVGRRLKLSPSARFLTISAHGLDAPDKNSVEGVVFIMDTTQELPPL
eukprot:m.113611 g.113611  ORF g.113611 m.113611 type:complete len:594 (-) comp9424_c0_seq6:2767-4548(-)